MEERKTILYPQEQSYQAPLRQPSGRNRRIGTKLPWWRSASVGYFLCPFLIGTALLIAHVNLLFAPAVHLTGAPFILATVIIAWQWGVGPALLSILLGIIALATFIIPSPGPLIPRDWSELITYIPFVVAELIVALITAQREKAQQYAIAAEWVAQTHAQELAESNQALGQSNQQLERANQLKDIFLSRASHELKTPITTIRGQTQLILRRLAKSQPTATELSSLHTHLEKIDTQTRRLHALIDDLLEMSSLSSGKVRLRLTQQDFRSLCEEVVEDQRALSDRCIELELPPEPVMLQADSQRLTQVIINLVSNAVKYSPENTVIHVRMSQEPSHVLLTIHNDGPALSQEQQTRIFEPFYRTPETELSPIRGMGLGLSISKEIIERHRGQIWAESFEGKGTTFFVQLPL